MKYSFSVLRENTKFCFMKNGDLIGVLDTSRCAM